MNQIILLDKSILIIIYFQFERIKDLIRIKKSIVNIKKLRIKKN